MKPPTRLLDGAATELELRLLRAGAAEEPPPGALQRAADALGVQGAADGAVHAPQAAATPGTTFAAGKLALIAAAAITAGAGAWLASRPAVEAPALAPAAHARRAAPAAQPSAAAEPARSAEPAMAATSARALSEEIARLDAARRLLAARRPASALEALQSYERDHPNGALRQEATLLRIEALRRSGDKGRARSLAEQFLAENPDTPHAERARSLAFDGAHAR